MKIIKRNRIEVTAVRYFSKKPFKLIIILNMTFTGLHMKKQQFILLNHMQRITVKCMKYYTKVYFIVSTGCGTADEHTEHSAVAEWDAALRSVHRAFC